MHGSCTKCCNTDPRDSKSVGLALTWVGTFFAIHAICTVVCVCVHTSSRFFSSLLAIPATFPLFDFILICPFLFPTSKSLLFISDITLSGQRSLCLRSSSQSVLRSCSLKISEFLSFGLSDLGLHSAVPPHQQLVPQDDPGVLTKGSIFHLLSLLHHYQCPDSGRFYLSPIFMGLCHISVLFCSLLLTPINVVVHFKINLCLLK